jgi:hypothetical protein
MIIWPLIVNLTGTDSRLRIYRERHGKEGATVLVAGGYAIIYANAGNYTKYFSGR